MKRLIALVLLCTALPAAAEVTVHDRRGPQTFDAPPERLVVLDWALAEQVLDLDVAPVGVAETDNYRTWVVHPALPEDVVDVGLRTEPNLERIAQLSPDAILTADVEPEEFARLEEIAPVVVFDAWDADHDNVAAALRIYRELGALLDREALAQDRLAAQEAELDAIAAELAHRFGPDPKATAIRLNDKASAWVYGENSVPLHVLRRLDFEPEIEVPSSTWGVATRRLEDLAQAETGVVLAIRPHMGGAEAMQTPLWDFLPFVANGRFAEVAPVWSYGGALSLGRHARAFRDALLALE
ncbi:iron-siderophore ABC transporter substrate-binding protein [Tranquillimonas alkanivorans]|uniref:Iron complex transport system substrate-binding protein n=1 Tax=Tranquillimonas alkanivorans TaxID=441119 RepID=A0A1I5TGS1_9RHOB|nr:iron-siderophore ABC transporter substrate-binding protein [Tranquillimonas alkanivorans]SFP82233.1 iron complex transport system substrate-binding protein [Tranquillimonas alkanivorans]